MELRPGYKQTEVGSIPEEWETPKLRQCLVQSATYGVVKAGTFRRSGIPMLRGGDINDGTLANELPLISEEKSREYARTVLREFDVVIALVGYPGETAVVPARLAGANISRAVGLLRPDRGLSPLFLACYLNSPSGRKEFLRPGAGSAQLVVNLKDLNELRLPLPQAAEQRAIAGALGDVDALLGAMDRLIAKKRDLKQAAMQQLLTGQTRLPGFSGEWEVKRLGNIADIQRGASPRPIDSPIWYDSRSTVGWVRISDIAESDGQTLLKTQDYLSQKGITASVPFPKWLYSAPLSPEWPPLTSSR